MTRDERKRVEAVKPEIRALWAEYERCEREKTALYEQVVELRLSTTPFEDERDCPFFNGAHDVCNRGATGRNGNGCRCPNSPEWRDR